MTFAAAHSLIHCASCGAEPDELFCVDEFRRAEPDAWECEVCIRAQHPLESDPTWELLRSTEEVRA